MTHDLNTHEAVWPVTAKKLIIDEPEDEVEELGSWWRDLAAGSALAAFVVSAAVMFLR